MGEPEIVLIAAVADNDVIGAGNDMPWRLPSDLRRFKRLTVGRPVIMGRKTFQSIGKPLPDRPNIVVTRDASFDAKGADVVATVEAAIELARRLARDGGADSVIVMGGGEIYRATIALADRLEITRVHAMPEGDTHFPDIDAGQWRETAREGPERGEKDSAEVTYLTYRRRV
ncbi:dihydrofolate reductase [Stappia sediminis]|uniref:dihydrofolate reductase n=1 Tax=Stappia sediminis TaxID=2692190 RepID=UPI0028A895A7|nr:dihydrofolate reductase [Stappia sediminis]